MNLPDKRKDYLDIEVYKLVELIETSETVPINKIEFVSDNNAIIDLSDKFNNTITTTETRNSNNISIKKCQDKICRELKGVNYQKFIKFVETIYNSKGIDSIVSKSFLHDLVFEYIIDSHIKQKKEGNFSDYLLDKIEEEIKEYKIYFSIHNLEINKPLNIGKVNFALLERDLVIETNNKSSESVELFYKKYGSKLFASFSAKAEKNKAIEIAFSECCLAVDILKICSDTIDDPLLKLSFDIDSRISENISSEMLVKNIKIQNDLSINVHRLPTLHVINSEYLMRLEFRNLNFFKTFLLNLPVEKSELEKILINAIRRFAKALSTNNLNQRIVELFTIMESLLVPNNQANIIESLTRYCSKIVFKEKEERKKIISLIKSMYEIRSAYVHHASEKDFEINELVELQHTIHILIGKLIEKSRQYTEKKSILNEIDDAMLEAY